MKVPRTPHRWRVTPKRAIEIQRAMSERVSLRASPRVRRVVGLDCAFGNDEVFAVGVVWDIRSRRVLEGRGAVAPLTFPYVPGLLSFREVPVLLKVLRKIQHQVDALMCDGQGVAHPRRFGLASHLGVIVDMPSCGCAKSRLFGKHVEPASVRGSTTVLAHAGIRIGTIVRTRDGVKPIYSSPGHRMSFDQAARLTLACAVGYRLPEPTRLADRWVGLLKRGEVSTRRLDHLRR